jgi:O-antigen/teichoic acid export membrane protein
MQLLRGAGVRLAGQGVGGLASLAVLPFLIRHLGVAEFGRYVAVLSVVTIAALVSDIGLTGLALRDSARAQGDRRAELLSGLMGIRLVVAALGVVASVGFAAAAGYDGDVVGGAAIASAGLFPQIYADMVVVTLVVDGRFAAATGVETARSVGSSLLIIALVVAGAGLPWFLAAWAGAALIAAATARRFGRGAVSFTRPSRTSVKTALAGSAGYTLATALHVIYFRVVMLVVATRGAATAAGEYAAAFRITEFVGAAAGQAAGSATPTLARDPSAAKRVIAAAAGFGVLVGAALALLAPVVMQVLGGDSLKGAADTLRIQAIAAALMFPAFAAGAVLFTRHRYRAMVVANASALGVALVAALLLVPDHGANGAAVAACLGELVLVAAQGTASRRSQST